MILRLRAPFAAFRPFQAGSYRSTLHVIPPSAAYGLVLNFAGIDARDSTSPGATRYKKDAPGLRIAVGNVSRPGVASLLQQLHSYPVGSSGKELAEHTYGAKYWIAPVRREVLTGFDGTIAFESSDGTIERRVADALAGRSFEPRYGLPFAGDNNFLFDRVDVDPDVSADWYERLAADARPRPGIVRLTVRIDREDQSRTELGLFAPSGRLVGKPEEAAWVDVTP